MQPDAARPRLATAASHPTWQVRAASAAMAAQIGDESTLSLLAQDAVPNVRTAAIEGLARMRSARTASAASPALESPDFQLVRAAAIALRGAPVEQRAAATAALMTSLNRLTSLASDTSRDPRVAVLERLGELLPPGDASPLEPWLTDFDPRVRAAASSVIGRLRGSEPAPAAASTVKHRYPVQPSIEELARLPRTAVIAMADGARIELDLLVDDAPVTVARFAELARAGYYNGLTFHRIAPNFVVQGGSPGANEYVGVHRYWRDEVGLASNLRGTVGLSTRGRDTGDGQFYFNLVDSPRLDHSYTVFARVRSGLDVVDGMLEGATMTAVTVR
jgi:cyclophilin family peptidyl-prolyl cis-trans isomerase